MNEEYIGFPQALLARPWQERVEYFQGYRMKHPFGLKYLKSLVDAIHELPSNSIILFIGPSGVGKTTIGQEVVRQLTLELMPELLSDPGRFATVSYECEWQHGKSYYWPGHYRGMLLAMQEPLVDRKRWPEPPEIPERTSKRFMPDSKATGPAYQPALINALLYRNPMAVLLDEAQHMTKISSGQGYEDQMHILKSIANRGNTVHVLLGTYELRHFKRLTAQLGRRGKIIHCSRYHASVDEEKDMFKNILWTFQQHLPVAGAPELARYWKYFYERSVGCVGVVKDWLTETLVAVYRKAAGEGIGDDASNSGTTDRANVSAIITLEDLQAHEPDLLTAMKMDAEAVEGENDLKPPQKDVRAQFRKELGLESVDDAKKAQGAANSDELGNVSHTASAKTKKSTKPFKQSPARHKLEEV